ncbi:MAG: type I restriction-modification system subunit M [Spirochaetaceae bacterium]|jgi:type I restriction enzyme M protein|nr:type I restriction-modification system subunit M [Spirochaetaceae bacterium]
MVTGELKSRVDRIWEMFWTGGITNPLDVIEQITYLIFIRDLDDIDNIRSRESVMLGVPHTSVFGANQRQYKWSVFRNLPAAKMYEIIQNKVFPFIKKLHDDKNSAYSKYMDDAIFKIPTPQLLEKVITALDEIDWKNRDLRGDLYEYLLSKLSTSGTNGQFRTPRHIIRMMVELLVPKPEDIICDPACGTSGFLVSAGEYLKEKNLNEIFYNKNNKAHYMNAMFHGYDMDRTMLRIGAMNMMTHGIDNPDIQYRDSLSDQNTDTNKYSLVLTNPPFKGSLDYDIVATDILKLTKTKKTELLFLALILRILKTGGRCASIVPEGVLFGSSAAHRAIRKEIVEKHRLEAVVSMPSGVFKPYAGVSTAVLVFTKTGHGGTEQVWFYDMKADGLSLDDKRSPIADNDIPDIISRFHALKKETRRKRTEKSFLVPKQEIIDKDYDLSINKYKETEYVAEKYPPTKEILAEIKALEAEIAQGLRDLEKML